jgi:MFS family permease
MQYPFRAIYEWETKDTFDSWSGAIQACNVLGGLAGVFLTAPLLPLGRWKGLLIANIVIIVGSLISMVESELWLVIGRSVYGVGVGIISVLGPKFLSEILPIELRGPLGTVY